MALDRRAFLKVVSAAGAASPGIVLGAQPRDGPEPAGNGDSLAILVDIPNCIGCRKCEYACQKAAGFDTPPVESFDDKSVYASHRRPHPRSHTTVNRFPNPRDAEHPIHVKANCLHCLDPACASACLVGALRRQPSGAVAYDASKCMGCRYCMVACPFQIPTYEYHHAFTPQVRKCTFCADRIAQEGGVPACVQICPNDALVSGTRSELLAKARERIRSRPEVYVDHIYGEHEAGGTSWLYLSSVPFEQIGFLSVGDTPPHRATESVQHALFKFFVPPLALYGLLGLMTWITRREPEEEPDATAGGGRAGSETARDKGWGGARSTIVTTAEDPDVSVEAGQAVSEVVS